MADADDVAEALAVVPLHPARVVRIVPATAGEHEGEERDRRDGGQRRVVLFRKGGDGQQLGAVDGRPRGHLDDARAPPTWIVLTT